MEWLLVGAVVACVVLGVGVVTRRPAPEWVLMAVPATIAACGRDAVGGASFLAGFVGAAAAFAAWLRPGSPVAAEPPWAGLGVFVVGAVATVALTAWTRTEGAGSALWIGALALALALRSGAVAAETSKRLARANVVVSLVVAVGALSPWGGGPEPLLAAVLAVALWAALGRGWSAIASLSLVVGAIPLGLAAGWAELTAGAFEGIARAEGAWDHLPLAEESAEAFDCVPWPGDTVACRYTDARVVRAQDPVPDAPRAFVARDPTAWWPSSRVRLVLVGGAPAGTPTLRLVGEGLVERPGGERVPIVAGDGRLAVAVEPAGGTYADLARLCGGVRCQAWTVDAEIDPIDPQRAGWIVGGAVFGLGVAAWVRRAALDAGSTPASALPAAFALVALVASPSHESYYLLALPIGVCVGLVAAARATAGRASLVDRAVGVASALALAVAPLGLVPSRFAWISGWIALLCALPCALVPPAGAVLRLRLAGWATGLAVIPVCGVLAYERAHELSAMGAVLTAGAALAAIPAFPEGWRQRRRIELAAVSAGLAVAFVLAAYTWLPSPLGRALDALDRPDLPRTDDLFGRWVPQPSTCVGSPPRELATGAPCSRATLAVLPAHAPAALLLADGTEGVVIRTPVGLQLRRTLIYAGSEAEWGTRVVVREGMTVQDVIDACDPGGSCVLAPPGVLGAP